MLPYIHHRKFTFEENSQQLNAKPGQSHSPQFFLQNNNKSYTPINSRDHKSLEKRDSIAKTRPHRMRTEASTPKNSQTPQPLYLPQPGPGHYLVKYDLVQQKAPTAKIYTEPSTINTNETLNKYLTTELINKKMLQRRKSIVDGTNLSPGPAKYMNENNLQKNSVSFKFSQSRRDDSLFSGGGQPSTSNQSQQGNDFSLFEFVDPKFGNGIRQKLRGNTLCDLDININRMFARQDLTLIAVPNTQQHYKGRSFSKSPKKLSPRHIDDDMYINENNYDDISNENPGPGHYEIQGHFDQKNKANVNKHYKQNKSIQYERNQKQLLRPLQPPRQISSPSKAHHQEFNAYMQELRQSLQQTPVSYSPQSHIQQDNQFTLNTIANLPPKYNKLQNHTNQQRYLDNGFHIQNENHITFPHDFIKYDEQILTNNN